MVTSKLSRARENTHSNKEDFLLGASFGSWWLLLLRALIFFSKQPVVILCQILYFYFQWDGFLDLSKLLSISKHKSNILELILKKEVWLIGGWIVLDDILVLFFRCDQCNQRLKAEVSFIPTGPKVPGPFPNEKLLLVSPEFCEQVTKVCSDSAELLVGVGNVSYCSLASDYCTLKHFLSLLLGSCCCCWEEGWR